jgi:hypothetical protein
MELMPSLILRSVSPAGISLASLAGMLFFDFILYTLLAYYLDKVRDTRC